MDILVPGMGNHEISPIRFLSTSAPDWRPEIGMVQTMESQVQIPAPQPPAPPQPLIRNCVSCGRSISWDANVCSYCGHDYRVQMMMGPPPPPRTLKPVIGGVLIIIAALLALGMGAMAMTMDTQQVQDAGVDIPEGMTAQDLQDVLNFCGAILLVFAVIAIIGGAFALGRKHFWLVVIGGVFGIFGIGMVIGAILSLIGLVLVAVSKDEFS